MLHCNDAGIGDQGSGIGEQGSGTRARGSLLVRLCALTLLLALAAGAACSRPNATEEGEAAAVPTITADIGRVTRQDLVEALPVRGVVTAPPNEDVRISALVAGRVIAMKVAEGDAVRAGQVVAELDPRPLQDQLRQATAAVAQAKAALENARLNFARTQRLFERGIAAGKEVEDARNQEAAAQAALDQAAAGLDTGQRQVARTRVVTPIGGYVVKRLVSVGEQVDGTAAQPLLQVANIERVEVAASVPAEHVPAVRVGQKAAIVADGASERLTGEVIAIAPAIDPATNAATARIRVANAGRALKVGMFALARIAVSEHRGALTVPPAAVSKSESGEAAVYVVTNGVAQRTPVKVGLETPEAVELLSGVAEGQAVLTSGVHGLAEKARVKAS